MKEVNLHNPAFGKDKKGLPIGIQLMADHFQERLLLQMAYALERESLS